MSINYHNYMSNLQSQLIAQQQYSSALSLMGGMGAMAGLAQHSHDQNYNKQPQNTASTAPKDLLLLTIEGA